MIEFFECYLKVKLRRLESDAKVIDESKEALVEEEKTKQYEMLSAQAKAFLNVIQDQVSIGLRKYQDGEALDVVFDIASNALFSGEHRQLTNDCCKYLKKGIILDHSLSSRACELDRAEAVEFTEMARSFLTNQAQLIQ
jgi:hypothetical protein